MTFTEFVVAFDGRIVPIEVKAGAGIDRFMERPHPAVRRLAPGEATIACGTAAPGAP